VDRSTVAGACQAGGGAAGAGGRSESAWGASGSLAGGGGGELWGADAAGAAEPTGELDGAGPEAVCGGPACTVAGAPESTGSRRTANTALHTVQRARTPASGTFTGSTRYTVAQFGQVTFIW
jgi:hypothetical protein